MHEPNDDTHGRRQRIGSLFSGYSGLDLAVEEVFNGQDAEGAPCSAPASTKPQAV